MILYCVAICSVTYSEESKDDEQPNASLVNSSPEETEELNSCHTEAQDMDSFNSCTQGDADQQNLEGNEQPSNSQDTCQSKEENGDQQTIRSPEQVLEVKKKITYAKLLKEGRRFNIDLVSKVSVYLIMEILYMYIHFALNPFSDLLPSPIKVLRHTWHHFLVHILPFNIFSRFFFTFFIQVI